MSLKTEEIFRLLGIEISSEADLDQVTESFVKRQYRKLALKLHPDKNKDDPNAEVRFNQLKMAHDIMMDETKRKNHTQTLRAQLQRMEERKGRDAEKRKFAEDLERRESEWTSSNMDRVDVERFRARHRALIEDLQSKRDAARIQLQRAGGTLLTAYSSGPDDTNMSLDYWLNFGLNEDLEMRRTKIERFSQFIAHRLPR